MCGHIAFISACEQQGSGQQNDESNHIAPDNDENGVTTTRYSANASEPQTFQASGSSAIKNAAITILPGSLGLDTEVSIEEGEAIANEDTGANLGLDDTTLASGGPAVAITSSQLIDAIKPFTIALPLGDSAALLQTGKENIVVVYKAIKAADAGAFSLGVIPTNMISVENGVAKVDTSWFGVYQVAYASKPVVARVEVPTVAPILVKGRTTILTGRWKSPCNDTEHENDHYQPKATNGSTFGILASTTTAFRLQNPIGANQDSQLEDPEWEIQNFTFSHDRLNFSMRSYMEDTCQKGKLKIEIGGSYLLTGSAPIHADARNVDVKIDSFIFTILNAGVTTDANNKKLCGFSDWVQNISRVISNIKDCKLGDEAGDNLKEAQSTSSCKDGPPELGKTLYTIVLVEGNTLKMGMDTYPNCGDSAEHRNKELGDEPEDILTKY